MNKVILMGRLTADPEIRWLGKGKDEFCSATFTLAVNRRNNRDEADFIRCKITGKIAEVIEKHTEKGKKLIVEGWWKTGQYENRDGYTAYTNDCYVTSIEFPEPKKKDDEQEEEKKTSRGTSKSTRGRGGKK